jgi:hypothetical protein
VTALNPARNATITKGGDFDLNVTLKNIGISTWDANNIDFRYLSGAKFQESKDALDLPKEVKPGETVNFIIDMIANTDTGPKAQPGHWCKTGPISARSPSKSSFNNSNRNPSALKVKCLQGFFLYNIYTVSRWFLLKLLV